MRDGGAVLARLGTWLERDAERTAIAHARHERSLGHPEGPSRGIRDPQDIGPARARRPLSRTTNQLDSRHAREPLRCRIRAPYRLTSAFCARLASRLGAPAGRQLRRRRRGGAVRGRLGLGRRRLAGPRVRGVIWRHGRRLPGLVGHGRVRHGPGGERWTRGLDQDLEGLDRLSHAEEKNQNPDRGHQSYQQHPYQGRVARPRRVVVIERVVPVPGLRDSWTGGAATRNRRIWGRRGCVAGP